MGIWAGYEAGLTIDHNSLDHLPYSGISVGWGWNQPESQKSVLRDNKVTGNRITDVMEVAREQHDGGAIYTQGAQPGTVLSGNYINRSAFGNTERDGNGIYLDEQSSHIRVERNVITRIGYKWVSNWADYGIENTARGNWTDTAAPALGGKGSVMTDNLTGLDRLLYRGPRRREPGRRPRRPRRAAAHRPGPHRHRHPVLHRGHGGRGTRPGRRHQHGHPHPVRGGRLVAGRPGHRAADPPDRDLEQLLLDDRRLRRGH